MSISLKYEDIKSAADKLQVEIPVILAVTEVEARGSGFYKDNYPIIVFEGHVFWDRLIHHGLNPYTYLSEKNQDIVYPKWDLRYHKGQKVEWEQLLKARQIHHNAANESCSWGMFQIMGYHWQKLGYNSINNFVQQMSLSEGAQLEGFVRYVQSYNLVTYLQKKDWSNFARRYNGPGYKKNKYDIKLQRAYLKNS